MAKLLGLHDLEFAEFLVDSEGRILAKTWLKTGSCTRCVQPADDSLDGPVRPIQGDSRNAQEETDHDQDAEGVPIRSQINQFVHTARVELTCHAKRLWSFNQTRNNTECLISMS